MLYIQWAKAKTAALREMLDIGWKTPTACQRRPPNLSAIKDCNGARPMQARCRLDGRVCGMFPRWSFYAPRVEHLYIFLMLCHSQMQEYCRNTARIVHKYCRNNIGMLQEYCGNTYGKTAGILQEDCGNTPCTLKEYCRNTAGMLQEHCRNTERLREYCRNRSERSKLKGVRAMCR